MVIETTTLINAVKKMYPVAQFFKDRYFPDGKIFWSEKALIESKKEGRKAAPFVIPIVNGIAMNGQGYSAEEVKAPYIVPKMSITPAELALKSFGESPESERSPEDRENEVQAEHMDDLRKSVLRRLEWMCTSIVTTGNVRMKHFASAEDAAKDQKYQIEELRFYDRDGEFGNHYRFAKDFKGMTARERILAFYEIHSILSARGIKATDIVMTVDVSMLLMTDPEFLDFYNKLHVNTGAIDQKELPEGVSYNGSINVNGVIYSMYTYAESFEDLDGEVKSFLPAGTIAFLRPGMGTTAYAQVTFIKDGHFTSHADKLIPRVIADEGKNIMEVQMFSRPVPYPLDWDGWIVANIYDSSEEGQSTIDEMYSGKRQEDDTEDSQEDGTVSVRPEEEISRMSTKKELIAYAASIGLDGLNDKSSLEDLRTAVIIYQQDL